MTTRTLSAAALLLALMRVPLAAAMDSPPQLPDASEASESEEQEEEVQPTSEDEP